MNRFVLATLLVAAQGAAVAAEPGQLDASPALFSVMGAINAAGYDAELDSPNNDPLRDLIRGELKTRKIACLDELKTFVAVHRKNDPTAELSQYVSFALSVDGPPTFNYRYKPNELPLDVLPLAGFEKLLARFYAEANMEQLWKKSQPAIDVMIEKYHEPATKALLEVNGYLRNATSGQMGARFQIFVDPLGAPNQVQTRSYGREYFVVLTPSPEPQGDAIRHAYLHFMLDPLSLRYAKELNEKKSLIDYAEGCPILDEAFKNDFLLLAGESLIKAVEARLGPQDKRNGTVDQALREGFILTPFFAEQLPLYDKQEQGMRFYYQQMVSAINLKRETQRLEGVQFLSERPVRKVRVAERPIQPTGPQKTVQEAEDLLRKRDVSGAKAAFSKLLKEADQPPLQARAHYGLARVAALERDPELAESLFQKTLEFSPEPAVKAWALIYLGRLADARGDRAQATEKYQAALKVEGASQGAKEAAEKGLKEAFQKPN